MLREELNLLYIVGNATFVVVVVDDEPDFLHAKKETAATDKASEERITFFINKFLI